MYEKIFLKLMSLLPHSGEKRGILSEKAEEPLDEKKIFTRFYHSGGKKDSSGLGLSIVKAICQRYGFSIKYYFEEGLHVFEINLKSATYRV